MGGRPTKTDQETGFLRGVWDTIGEIEADSGGVVTIYLSRSTRPGVLYVRMVFTPMMGGEQSPITSHAVTGTFPGPQNSAFAGELFRMALGLQRLVDEQLLRRQPARKA